MALQVLEELGIRFTRCRFLPRWRATHVVIAPALCTSVEILRSNLLEVSEGLGLQANFRCISLCLIQLNRILSFLKFLLGQLLGYREVS